MLIGLFSFHSIAQQQDTTTIILKNGSIIIGIIKSQTRDTLEVESANGVVKIATADVRRIKSRFSKTGEQLNDSNQIHEQAIVIEDAHHEWGIIAGLGIPMGEFASSSTSAGGFASNGWCVGAYYRIEITKNIETGIAELFNYSPVDNNEFAKFFPPQTSVDVNPWLMFWSVGSIGISSEAQENSRLYIGGLLGVVTSASPLIRAAYNGMTIQQSTSTASAFSYGAEMGYTLQSFNFGLRYITAEPVYVINIGSQSFKAKQPTSVLNITIGLIIH